jgi:hypothetical protein
MHKGYVDINAQAYGHMAYNAAARALLAYTTALRLRSNCSQNMRSKDTAQKAAAIAVSSADISRQHPNSCNWTERLKALAVLSRQ